VATPLHWAEPSDRRLDPQGWTVTTIGERLAGVGDPRSGLAGHAGGLGPARRAQERCYA
jgi:DNA primase